MSHYVTSRKKMFLSHRWLSWHLFLCLEYLFRVWWAHRWKENQIIQKFQSLSVELWHSCLSAWEAMDMFSVSCCSLITLPDLFSITPVYFGLRQFWIFVSKGTNTDDGNYQISHLIFPCCNSIFHPWPSCIMCCLTSGPCLQYHYTFLLTHSKAKIYVSNHLNLI